MNYTSFKKQIATAEKKQAKLKLWDNRFASFRLISTISLLAIVVSIGQKSSFFNILILSFLFLFYCLVTSLVHKKFQLKYKFWSAVVKSYQLSRARVKRDFDYLKQNISPWHNAVCILPTNHIYACDLDLHKELFLFMNTCSTPGGSRLLFKLLLNAGGASQDLGNIEDRIFLSKKLSTQKSLLRRFESMRLNEDFLKNYYDINEAEQTQNESKSLDLNFTREIFYSCLCFIAWIFLFVPQIIQFIKTKNTEVFLQPVFSYAVFIAMGVYFFDSLIKKALFVSKNTKYIELIINGCRGPKFEMAFDFMKSKSIKRISQMNLFVDILSLRGNPVFWILIHVFFPFDALFSLLLIFKIKKISPCLTLWQDEVHEFDLCVSFARMKSENSEFNFFLPEKKYENNLSSLEMEKLGHPLISAKKRVCNSISLTKENNIVLLTGSNMAGKSTFLRAFATNILLANMGAPICAKSFRIPKIKILCAIRIDDSLAEGTSYFYAEVKRLAEILNEVKNSTESCLFFVDEIFKGTNNKERYIGGLSLIKAFLQTNSFGLVTTHDLALTDLAQTEPKLVNMHFKEHISEGKLSFDYLLKEGPCPSTNAVFIMKLAGLPV